MGEQSGNGSVTSWASKLRPPIRSSLRLQRMVPLPRLLPLLLALLAIEAQAQATLPGSVWALHAVEQGPIYAGSSVNGVYVSPDQGETFAFLGAAERHVWDLQTVPNALLVAVEQGPLLVSFNQGETFQPVEVTPGGSHGYDIAFNKEENRVYLATWGRGVFRAEGDDVTTWTDITANLPEPATPAVAASEYTNTVVASVFGHGSWRLAAGATTWSQAGTLDGNEAYALIERCGVFFAGTWGGGVYRSNTDGESFVFVGLEGLHVYDFTHGPDCAVYAATSNGLYLTNTQWPPTQWEHVGYEDEVLYSVTVRDDGTPCVGSAQGHVTCGVQPVSAEPGLEASGLALAAPYPNPVSTGTPASITFTLAEAGPARLTVVDVLGREVARLADGQMAAGEHVMQWEPRALASGVYLLRLSTQAGAEVRRIVVR